MVCAICQAAEVDWSTLNEAREGTLLGFKAAVRGQIGGLTLSGEGAHMGRDKELEATRGACPFAQFCCQAE